MSSTIGIKNRNNYITLESGFLIPNYKKDIEEIIDSYSEIILLEGDINLLSVGIPVFNISKRKLKLLPGAIFEFSPFLEEYEKISVRVEKESLEKLFKDIRLRKDLKEQFYNPKFVNGYEQKYFDGLDGEYKRDLIQISLNKNNEYVGFNIDWYKEDSYKF